jgi:hypothetical protein
MLGSKRQLSNNQDIVIVIKTLPYLNLMIFPNNRFKPSNISIIAGDCATHRGCAARITHDCYGLQFLWNKNAQRLNKPLGAKE